MKLTLVYIYLIALFLPSKKIEAQVTKEYQQSELFAYNALFGGVTSGVGSIINKAKGKSYISTFLKGFGLGVLGGSINFCSKKLIYEVNVQKNYNYAMLANLGISIGNSITYSAALNKPIGTYWNIDLWATRFELDFNKGFKSKVKLLPTAIIGAGILTFINAKFDFECSLRTGVLIFNFQEGNEYGLTYMRAIAGRRNSGNPYYEEHYVLAHELIHYNQFREYSIFNTWLKPLEKRISAKYKTPFEKWIYFDMPWIYPFYSIQGEHSSKYYFNNFYEYEAESFSTNSYIKLSR